MKQYLSIIFFFSLWTSSAAQDWAPVRVGDTYHYKWYPVYNPSVPWNMQYPRVGEEFISPNIAVSVPTQADEFSIRVDSVTAVGLDSQYQYQERFGRCESCPVLAISEILEGDSIGLFPKVIKKGAGKYSLIYNEDTLELSNNLQVVSTTNPAYGVYISSTFWDNIYDHVNLYGISTTPVYDSMIYISIDTSNTGYPSLYQIQISKNNGLVYFETDDFAWQIAGKEGNGNDSGYETTQMEFQDVYGFDVGDQFYYHSYTYEGGGVSTWPYLTNVLEFWYRWKILHRQDTGTDTIDYTIERVYYNQGYPVFQNLGIADTFIKSYIHSEDSFYTMTDLEIRCSSQTLSCVGCKDLFGVNGNSMKYIGYDFNLTAQQNFTSNADDYISVFHYPYNVNYYAGIISPFQDFPILYHKGLGRVYEGRWRSQDYADTRELVGYIKGIDTVGSTPNITIYTSTKATNGLIHSIKLLNNPTNNHLSIHYQNSNPKKMLHFSVLNALGQELTSYEEADQSDKIYTFPIQNLASGVYFLEVKQDGQLLQTEQFVKQ